MSETPATKLCQHCGRYKVGRPRNLCVSCFYRPGVRALYPLTAIEIRRRRGKPYTFLPFVTNHERANPPSPTAAPPGSHAKINEMAKRFQSGYHIHHPGDAY